MRACKWWYWQNILTSARAWTWVYVQICCSWPAKVWAQTGVWKVWFLSIVAKELAFWFFFFLDKRSWQEATKWRGKHWFKRQYFKLHPGVRGRALTLMTLILLGNSCWLVSRRFISRPRAPKERPCPRSEDSALLSGLQVWLNWHQWKVSLNKFESPR